MEQGLISAAVIGCGRMGAFTSESVRRHAPPCWLPLAHAEAIAQHPRLSLVALADVDRGNVEKAADHYGVQQRFTDARHLIENLRPMLLGIATRTPGRAGLIEFAANAGVRAIHTEKPLCNSVHELEMLGAVFKLDDLFITWGAVRRFFGVYRQALALAESGRYGALKEIRVNFGSAPLYWTHPHAIDLLLFAAGTRKVTQVQARLGALENRSRVTRIENDPVAIAASVHFDDGVAGHITQALGADFILSCQDAEIAVRADGWRLELYGGSDQAYPASQTLAIDEDRLPGGTLAPVSMLVDCLMQDQESIRANARLKDDILRAQSIAFAMLQSHLEGSRAVALEAIDPALEILAASGGRPA